MRSKKALYNIVTNLLLQVVVIVYGFVVPRIIIGKYGSDINGLMSSITSFLAYISLVEAGFGGVVQYLLYKPIAKKDNQEINDILAASQRFFSKVSAIFILYVLILCIVYPLVINTGFDSLFTVSLIIIISISTFAEYYFGLVYKVFLFADQKKYVVSIFSIITYVLNIIAVVVLNNFDVPVQVLKLVSTLLFVIRPILQNVYVRKKYNISLKEGNKNYVIRQKWDALVQHIASVIHTSTDAVVLSIFRNMAEVSVYMVYSIVVNGVRKISSIFYDSISSGFGDLIARKETKKLNEVFNAAESLFFTFVTIIFSCTFVMITPFVEVYTNGVTDTDYIQPLFGVLIVCAEFLSTVRCPYSSITLAAGHYKQTRNGAILECLLNLLTSLALVASLGLVGVAIGTIVAMFVRTCEFIYHSNKYILQRKVILSINKIIIMILEIVLIICISNVLPFFANNGYAAWLINVLIVFILSCAICFPINAICYRREFRDFKIILKRLMKDKRGK